MASYTEPFSFAGRSLDDTLIDLGVRFVINCPPEDISTAVRLFFQLEEAHWFYEDFAREQNQSLPSLKMKAFVSHLYKAMPLMALVCADPDAALAEFQSYKNSIPVRGGILVNETLDKVLMVRSWKGASWGFPKGKINKEEDDAVCAVREVLEETGYDMGPLIDRGEYIESTYGGKNIRLYVVSGIPEKTHFETQTRKEISRIDWIPLKHLPVFNRKPKGSFNFYMVTPFMGGLKNYIARRKGYVTKLSESESSALKSMLGISSESDEPVRNDEATAQHLLSMLRDATSGDSDARLQPTPTPAVPLASSNEALPATNDSTIPGAGNKQDRDILLNLLKQGTPEPATHDAGANQKGADQKAEVEGTKEILALLQQEMATKKTVSAPSTIEPLESADHASKGSAHAPALPPMGLLESLVQSRRTNPVRKTNVPNPNEHRSTAPSRNSLLNLLNRPKQSESAKLMALLKPVKQPQPAAPPKRSALMSLLETAGSHPQDMPPTTSLATSSAESSSHNVNQGGPTHGRTSLGEVAAPNNEKSAVTPQKPPSSLLGLLNPEGAVKPQEPPQSPGIARDLSASAFASTPRTASPDPASTRGTDPEPISTMTSAPGRAADAEPVQQEPERSSVATPAGTRESPPRAGDALLGLLNASAIDLTEAAREKAAEKVNFDSSDQDAEALSPHGSYSSVQCCERTQDDNDPAPVPSEDHNGVAEQSGALVAEERAKTDVDPQSNDTKNAPERDTPPQRIARDRAKETNPLLKLLEPSSQGTQPLTDPIDPGFEAGSRPIASKPGPESQRLMSLLAAGASSRRPVKADSPKGAKEASASVHGRSSSHDAEVLADDAPVTTDENVEKRASTKSQIASQIHLLKLLK